MKFFARNLLGWQRMLGCVMISVALAACVATGYLDLLKPGARAEDVRKRRPPTREWKQPDGRLVFEYAGDLAGEPSQRLNFDQNGLFVDWYLPVSRERAEGVRPAMTRKEVLAILGEPNRRSISSMSGGEVWEWVLGVRSIERGQRCIVVEWHPTVDGLVRVFEDNYSFLSE